MVDKLTAINRVHFHNFLICGRLGIFQVALKEECPVWRSSVPLIRACPLQTPQLTNVCSGAAPASACVSYEWGVCAPIAQPHPSPLRSESGAGAGTRGPHHLNRLKNRILFSDVQGEYTFRACALGEDQYERHGMCATSSSLLWPPLAT